MKEQMLLSLNNVNQISVVALLWFSSSGCSKSFWIHQSFFFCRGGSNQCGVDSRITLSYHLTEKFALIMKNIIQMGYMKGRIAMFKDIFCLNVFIKKNCSYIYRNACIYMYTYTHTRKCECTAPSSLFFNFLFFFILLIPQFLLQWAISALVYLYKQIHLSHTSGQNDCSWQHMVLRFWLFHSAITVRVALLVLLNDK